MRRVQVFPGAIPQEQDVLNGQKNTMVSIGHVLQDMLGTGTLFSGLGCVPTTVPGMTVNVNPGRAYSLQATDTGAYSSLAADSRSLVKQGILLDLVNFACPAPTTAGFSINYLIQGAFQEIDAGSTVLPYYNAANPAVAFSGPNGTGTSNTTYRDNTVQLQLKPGAAATTGSQVTPTPDAGFNGLWVVTVAFGQTTITSTSIAQFTGAPFLSASLLTQIQAIPAHGIAKFTSSGSFTVPPGVTTLYLSGVAPGGAGGAGGGTATAGQVGAGGGGGGSGENVIKQAFNVTPGAVATLTIPTPPNFTAATGTTGTTGTNAGNLTVSGALTLSLHGGFGGGGGGSATSGSSGGGAAGQGGTTLMAYGAAGQDATANNSSGQGGMGASSPFGGGGGNGRGSGNASFPGTSASTSTGLGGGGGGGGGNYLAGSAQTGGAGGPGGAALLIIEW